MCSDCVWVYVGEYLCMGTTFEVEPHTHARVRVAVQNIHTGGSARSSYTVSRRSHLKVGVLSLPNSSFALFYMLFHILGEACLTFPGAFSKTATSFW